MQTTSNKPACQAVEVEITCHDLPLSCPPRDKRMWDAHPRVYLPIDKVGTVRCPYCGTLYHLKSAATDDTKPL